VRIAVVVAWDGRRPEWLSAALRTVDGQVPAPAERCLVVDSPDATAALAAPNTAISASGWTIRQGYWCDPAADRNEGMAATRSPWVVFWDTDNVMPAGFLAAVREAIRHATPDVGILYSDIEYVDEKPELWQAVAGTRLELLDAAQGQPHRHCLCLAPRSRRACWRLAARVQIIGGLRAAPAHRAVRRGQQRGRRVHQSGSPDQPGAGRRPPPRSRQPVRAARPVSRAGRRTLLRAGASSAHSPGSTRACCPRSARMSC
jgi:hypothetical protein